MTDFQEVRLVCGGEELAHTGTRFERQAPPSVSEVVLQYFSPNTGQFSIEGPSLRRAMARTRPRSLLLRFKISPPITVLMVCAPMTGCSSRWASAIISGLAMKIPKSVGMGWSKQASPRLTRPCQEGMCLPWWYNCASP